MGNGEYQVLLIDLDGTVVDYARTEAAALASIYRSFFCGLVDWPLFAGVFHACNDELWAAYRRHEIDLDALRAQRFTGLLRRLGLPGMTGAIPGVAALFEAELGRGVQLFADSFASLRALRSLARLILVTDGIAAVQRAKLARTRLRMLFDHVVISSEVGYRKPDPALLPHALASAGAGRHAALVVGDSLASDGAGAQAAGIDFCWVNRAAGPPRQARATAPSVLARTARGTRWFQVADLAALARRLVRGVRAPGTS